MTTPFRSSRYSFGSSSQKEHLGNVKDFRVRNILSAGSDLSYSFTISMLLTLRSTKLVSITLICAEFPGIWPYSVLTEVLVAIDTGSTDLW